MNEVWKPCGMARRLLLRRALSAGAVVIIAGSTRIAAAQGAQVTIENFTFSPTPLTVKVGATVMWMNRDDTPHSVVIPTLKVRSKAMDSGESFSYAFQQAGTYDYICGLHPFMHGQVMVQA